jgi:hypothetical protein
LGLGCAGGNHTITALRRGGLLALFSPRTVLGGTSVARVLLEPTVDPLSLHSLAASAGTR